MILKLAFRNIFRNKKRTILTLITIIFGIFVSIFGSGLNSGLKWQLADIYIKTETSSFKIYKKGFYNKDDENNPLKYPIKNEEKIIKFLKNIKEVKYFSKKIVFNGQLTDGVSELPVRFLGIDPISENKLFKLKDFMVQGTFIENNDNEKIVIGSELASSLKLKVKDYVTIIARDKNRTINAYDVIIKGIIKTNNPIINSKVVYLSENFAKTFANTEFSNDISVLCKNNGIDNLKNLFDKLRPQLNKNNIEAIGWFEQISDLFQLIEFREKIFMIITAIILIMAGAGIANTMLMSMLERKKEIGIMMACGMDEKKILILFLLEGILIGFIGSLIGMILGSILVDYFQINGLPIPAGKGNPTDIGIPIETKLYLHLDHIKVIYYFFIGILTSAISAFYPAYKATKLDPVEAIRE